MILVCLLVATNDRVRERALLLVGAGRPLAGLADVGGRLSDLGRIVVHVVWVFSLEHLYWTMLAVAATMLVVAVLRL
jgi:hypothetical protein